MQVVQADEAVFDAVQAKFTLLTANLLPKLVCPGTLAVLPMQSYVELYPGPISYWGSGVAEISLDNQLGNVRSVGV